MIYLELQYKRKKNEKKTSLQSIYEAKIYKYIASFFPLGSSLKYISLSLLYFLYVVYILFVTTNAYTIHWKLFLKIRKWTNNPNYLYHKLAQLESDSVDPFLDLLLDFLLTWNRCQLGVLMVWNMKTWVPFYIYFQMQVWKHSFFLYLFKNLDLPLRFSEVLEKVLFITKYYFTILCIINNII